ncbi:uncharacterized protein FIBRA_09249 [Fibroporia radiculosa]|uniref:Tf2-1-like SH3-like domain-containing protein n=1 Tax=Fibroporia radiculosa TaxID=599839 RepID=J7RVL7_9APHY|nr:uncharacterized protein FIBRA_09249 [Fibroporia radiculosa]CCM06935.1 predicted protein [Fibroporia radiculosa]
MSPFQVLMGYQPRHNIPTVGTTDAPNIASRLTQLAHLCTEIQSSIRLAEETVKKRNKEKFVEYTPGQKVWLEATNLKGLHPKAKLGPKCYGPFTIDQKLSSVVYRLKLPPKWKIHPVFHAGLLYPYLETAMHRKNYLQPPPELIKNQEEFKIKRIIDSKTVGKRTVYQVSSISTMASTTLLLALLLISWFLTITLILVLAVAVFFIKETYAIHFHLDRNPTPSSSLPPPLLTYSVVNQVALLAVTTLTIVDKHPHLLLLAFLGSFLITLLAILALTLIIPLTLCTTIWHLEREHQWAFNIAATAQHPLPHTTTTLPVIAANRDSNNLTQVYFEYIREHQD